MSQFWRKVVTSGSGISSKRVMGIACILFAMLFAVAGLLLGVIGEVDGMVSTVVIEFLAAGVALFGVTAFEKKNFTVSSNSNHVQNQPTSLDYGDEEGGCSGQGTYIDENGVGHEDR